MRLISFIVLISVLLILQCFPNVDTTSNGQAVQKSKSRKTDLTIEDYFHENVDSVEIFSSRFFYAKNGVSGTTLKTFFAFKKGTLRVHQFTTAPFCEGVDIYHFSVSGTLSLQSSQERCNIAGESQWRKREYASKKLPFTVKKAYIDQRFPVFENKMYSENLEGQLRDIQSICNAGNNCIEFSNQRTEFSLYYFKIQKSEYIASEVNQSRFYSELTESKGSLLER